MHITPFLLVTEDFWHPLEAGNIKTTDADGTWHLHKEREEEIIRASWVAPAFKKQWIRFFYMLSDVIYKRACRVTCLFTNALKIQEDIGCAPEKCRVIENGVSYERFCEIPLKEEDGWVDIGAVVRLAPIKDIKTMIYAF